jgi:hypothetical protein
MSRQSKALQDAPSDENNQNEISEEEEEEGDDILSSAINKNSARTETV